MSDSKDDVPPVSEQNSRVLVQSRRGFLGWVCRIIPWKPKIQDLPEGMTPALKAEFIAQEHRLLRIVQNGFIFGQLPADDPRHQAAFTAGLWRMFATPTTVIASGSTILAICGIIVAFQTLRTAEKQTTLIENQNKQIEIQANQSMRQNVIAEQQKEQALIQNALAEANRMALLHGEVTELVKQILPDESNTEVKREPLSDDLLKRISSLARVLRPYRAIQWIEGEPVLDERPTSRERAELLLACAARETMTGREPFYARFDFSSADLRDVNLTRLNLRGCQLDRVDLRGANLQETDMTGASLVEADFRDANLTSKQSNVSEDTLNIFRIKLFNHFGKRKPLSAPTGLRVIADNYQPIGPAIFVIAKLHRANFDRAQAGRVDFRGADLTGATFENANLASADFLFSNLPEASAFMHAKIDDVCWYSEESKHTEWVSKLRSSSADLTDASFRKPEFRDIIHD